MKPGDLVRNKNSESGELGIFVGRRKFKNSRGKEYYYICSEVYWPQRKKVGTIQTNLIEVISETR